MRQVLVIEDEKEISDLLEIHLTDLKSANGTLLNGKTVKCGVRIEIRFGDIITFGKTRLKLVKG